MTSPRSNHLSTSGILIMLLLSTASGLLRSDTLKVYTWPYYMDPTIVSEFERQYDATIDFSYFSSDDARDEEMAYSNGRGFDVMLVNRLQIPKYVRRGWLQPLNDESIPNRRHIDPRWTDFMGEDSDFAVANAWGTLGIGYRQDLLPDGLYSWSALLRPREELRNRLYMPAFTRELIAIAMKSAGLSVNTSDETMIIEAGRQLLAQKSHVRHYGYPSLDETSDLVTGKIWAGAFYSGNVLTLQALEENIRFVIPEEGGVLWVDYLTVAQSSGNKSLAYALINFLNEPQVAARQARFANLATPNLTARDHLPQTYLEHPFIYPSRELVEQSEFLESLPPRSQKQINIIGTQLIN